MFLLLLLDGNRHSGQTIFVIDDLHQGNQNTCVGILVRLDDEASLRIIFAKLANTETNFLQRHHFLVDVDIALFVDCDVLKIHVGDDDGDIGSDVSGGLSFICRLPTRTSDNSFTDNTRDRDIRGVPDGSDVDNASGLGRPGGKGVALAHRNGYIFVADNAAARLRVFGAATTGNRAPLTSVALGVPPWDVAVDEEGDSLYIAMTNGTVRILDGLIAGLNSGAGGFGTREFRLVDAQQQLIGRNLHGIAYEPAGDRLVITDVGAVSASQSSSFNADGALYVLNGVGTRNGDIVPDVIFQGPLTRLGNPVDVAIWGRDVLVAEKANNQVLLFSDVFTSPGGNLAPAPFVLDAPESIALNFAQDLPLNGGALVAGSDRPQSILMSIDAGDIPRLVRLNTALGPQSNPQAFAVPGGQPHTTGVAVDATGDVYLASHSTASLLGVPAAESRVDVISRLAVARTRIISDPGTPNAGRDRTLSYNNPAGAPLSGRTAISEPVAAALDESRGLLFLADAAPESGQGAVHVVSACGSSGLLATATISDNNAGTPTDLDFDPVSGDLYVSMDNGNLAVFRNFNLQFANSPQPIIVQVQRLNGMGNPVAAATNLSAIEYVGGPAPIGDTLILADLGAQTGDPDGQILLLRNASAMGTAELVDVIISGAASQLNDPVDIAYDGADLLVLDSSRMMLSRYTGILAITVSGSRPPAPNPTPVDGYGGTPHSIALVPMGVAQPPQVTN